MECRAGAKTQPQLTVPISGRKPEIGLSFTVPSEARRSFIMWMTYKMLDKEWCNFLNQVPKGQWSKNPPRGPRMLFLWNIQCPDIRHTLESSCSIKFPGEIETNMSPPR